MRVRLRGFEPRLNWLSTNCLCRLGYNRVRNSVYRNSEVIRAYETKKAARIGLPMGGSLVMICVTSWRGA